MTSRAPNITKNLRQGIEAAQAGETDMAREYLAIVFRQDRNNIPALFWSAYIAPSPQESLHLLERILELEPNNERARSGIRWAKQRLRAAQVETASESSQTKPTPTQAGNYSPEMPDGFIRDQLPSKENFRRSDHERLHATEDENLALTPSLLARLPSPKLGEGLTLAPNFQKQAKKVAPAHRTRGRIDRLLLVVVIILGTAALLTAGIWAIALAPAKTLAAWLPAPAESRPAEAEAELLAPVAKKPVLSSEEAESLDPPKHFSSDGDTIIVAAPESDETTMTSTAFSAPRNFSVPVEAPAIARSIVEVPPELVAPAEGSSELISRTEAEGELSLLPPDESPVILSTLPGQTNPALNQPMGELIGPASEVLDGPRLFEPVDEALLAHRPASPDEKWIEVNVTTQRVTAWEGNVPVFSFISSTGLPGTPTVLGEFNIYWKLKSALMVGPDYYLPEVPYTMYFYGGYALHGTYWHDNFGQPMSHGCVNLSTDNAQQLFEWADPVLPPGQTQVTSTYTNPGTLVVAHE
jgi:hypothetical protein